MFSHRVVYISLINFIKFFLSVLYRCHVTVIEFDICCCVPNFIKIGLFFRRDIAI